MASGAIVKNGGRVMKNVTGYDLVKLMAGSWGTLGVLTEVAFKVLPAPEAAAGLSIAGLSELQAVEAMAVALGSPFEVTGAAHLPGEGRTLLRIEGFAASVAYRAGRLADLMAPFGGVEVETGPRPWRGAGRRIRDVEAFAGRPGDVWRISVKPTDGPGMAALTGGRVMFDWGGGLIWALVPEGTDLRARLGRIRGPCHAPARRARDAGPDRALPARACAAGGDCGGAEAAVRSARHPEPRPDGGVTRRMTMIDTLSVALPSALLFGTFALMSDRKRGAFLAQGALVVAVVAMFVAITASGTLAGLAPERIAAIATGLIAAAVAGMLYHLYLGRFERVWAARAVFSAVYLGLAGLFGLVFLSLF
jgi:hypothetical protein